MHLILDVGRIVQRLIKGQTLTGIDRVTMAYVVQYQHTAQALVRWGRYHWVLSKSQSQALFAWIIRPRSSFVAKMIIMRGSLFSGKHQPCTKKFLINTGHINKSSHASYLRIKHKYCIELIFIIHDLIPIRYPEYCSPGEANKHRDKIDFILNVAAGIITNSDSTRHELNAYARQTFQTIHYAKTARLASGIYQKRHMESPFHKPYFVILGTIEPRKNHLLLLNIWRKFFQDLDDQSPHLFIIGRRGWECEQVLDMLERCESLRANTTEISSCHDDDVMNYVHHAQALLFPSFVEGYGLPLVEALTLGVPVIASNLPVFYEIAGDVPDYADPLDGKRWETLILEYAQTNSLGRMNQLKRLKQFKKPSWKDHFTEVDHVLQGCLNSNYS